MRVNREIRALKVRLIGKDGEQVGIVTLDRALEEAKQAGLDLVEISPTFDPPVCKMLDYGRHRYQHTKKGRGQKKTQSKTKLKEIKFRPNINTHDVRVKTARARAFLDKGHKVKLTCTLRGAEMVHAYRANETMDLFLEDLKGLSQMESGQKFMGRNLVVVLSPVGKGVVKAEGLNKGG